MVAAIAVAHDGGQGGRGGPGGGDFGIHGAEGGELLIGSDGTAFLVSETQATSTTAGSTSVTAVSPTGAKLWSATIGAGRGRLVLSGNNLISVSVTQATTTTAASTTLTALSTATGTQAWTLTLDGVATDLRPFSGGTYAIVVKPAATSGGTATRSLVAISGSGVVLWTVAL
jgi:hypothetical protein